MISLQENVESGNAAAICDVLLISTEILTDFVSLSFLQIVHVYFYLQYSE